MCKNIYTNSQKIKNKETQILHIMVYWTTKSGERYLVNIEQPLIESMKKKGARFCWFRDTPGINDAQNETFYMTKGDEEDSSRALREGITVTAENGDEVTGYVSHWVKNSNLQTAGTNIQNWFIFQPGTYPTSYIISSENEVVVTDL